MGDRERRRENEVERERTEKESILSKVKRNLTYKRVKELR